MTESIVCPICLDNIKTPHSLTECGHSFCTTCIISWFRSGYASCPMCKDSGIGDARLLYSQRQFLYKQARLLSRKKNAPQQLKNQLQSLRKLEKVNKILTKEWNLWRHRKSESTPAEHYKISKLFYKKRQHNTNRLHTIKMSMISYIRPVIIPIKRKVS